MIGQTNQIQVKRPAFTSYQRDILYSDKRFTVTEACTKSGKTFSHLYWLFELAHGQNPIWYFNAVKSGMNFWWVAPIFTQSEIAFKRLVRKVEPTGEYDINKSKLTITTPQETILHFKSADNPESLYGEDVYGAVFDEFTRAKQEAWFALRSTLTFTKGPCKFIGNYTGSTNWGHKLKANAKNPDSDYACFTIDAYQAVAAGILAESEIDQARRDLPQSIFQALYLAEGSIEGDVLFHPDKLSDLFTNTFVKEDTHRRITADIATYGSDRFVVGIWFGWVLKKVYSIAKCEADEVERFIKEKAQEWRVSVSDIAYDADGIGSFLRGYLRGAKAFNNGAAPIHKNKDRQVNYLNLKTQCYYELSSIVKNSQMFITDQEFKEDIERELEVIRRDKPDADGKLRIIPKPAMKKVLGYSPDFADMIMMRYYFELLGSDIQMTGRAWS